MYAIREQCCKNVKVLAEAFGDKWIEHHCIPHMVQLASDTGYLKRLTCLFTINELAQVMDKKTTTARLLPILKQLAKDEVPNVRFNTAKSFKKVRQYRTGGHVNVCIDFMWIFVSLSQVLYLDEEDRECVVAIAETLATLRADSDPDVKFFAEEAFQDYQTHSSHFTKVHNEIS